MLTEGSREGGGAYETPMGAPKGEKGLFAGTVGTGDSIQIDLNNVVG
jgi:hypothetical protein